MKTNLETYDETSCTYYEDYRAKMTEQQVGKHDTEGYVLGLQR